MLTSSLKLPRSGFSTDLQAEGAHRSSQIVDATKALARNAHSTVELELESALSMHPGCGLVGADACMRTDHAWQSDADQSDARKREESLTIGMILRVVVSCH